MIPDCHPDELAQFWTLSDDERSLLANKSGATRLSFALLLKLFQRDGQFPERREIIATNAIAFIAQQVGVAIDVYDDVDWSERTQRHHRAQIRDFCEVSVFRAEDEPDFIAWLSDQVMSLNPEAEALKLAAYNHLCNQHIEPPRPDRLRRLLRTAVHMRETRFVAATVAQLSPAMCAALDRLIQTDSLDEDSASDQASLFPLRSDLATLKEDAGAVKVETVREEIEKLVQLRAVGLPDSLFRDTPPRFVTHYRQRAAGEKPRILRRHPADIRYALLAALCWQRQREITDSLVDLLIHIAQRIGVRAETKVDVVLQQYAKRVVGKTKLLYKLAKAATERPEGIVKDVIFPVVGEQTLDDVIREAEADARHEQQVKLVTRASYSHHYRRIVPTVLAVLAFQCNNELHRPVMDALALLHRYHGRKGTVFPLTEHVPMAGVVKDDWQNLVLDDKQGGRVNRISYELCVLTTLREKVRCKEVWVHGAQRFRNPDDDLPQDFEVRREDYYDALKQPHDGATYVATVRHALEDALTKLNASLPTNPKVKIATSKKGKGRIVLTPLDAQPEPPNIACLTAALVTHWPMTNLLDILKETELRVQFTDVFRTLGTREVLSADVLQQRLLLCLHGLGTNAGLKRMCSGSTTHRYADLLYVRRRYITKDQLRAAIAKVCNAIFATRQADLWGEATTACASDSKQFGAWDQNLMTEWHARYGGRGVMIYYHVERNAVCIYSQLKACSSSEVAAMIEGVLRHDTEMEVEQNYVDTHGQSEVGFAFCRLLGFHLLPRLKNLKKQRLYRPTAGEADRYSNLQAILARSINWEVIVQQYDELIKFATALRLGTADAEAILRRFTRSNVQHPTYKALCELGKALKTIFLCDYLRLESLRREIHEGLQVIETWNSANDFILYGKGGEFASNKLEDQELLMLSLHLLQVSLVYVNTLMIQQVLALPEWQGRLTPTDVRALTPLKWQHVNPYGTFTLNMQERLPLQHPA
ncbi:MAG: Tn3 family transposase [Chloroflexota bacterium]|nr:Tn3 family transposase [Chloroflexota bacterium]